MTRDTIAVVFATDDNYCQHLGVTIASLLERNPGERFDLRCICIDVATENKRRLVAVCEERGAAPPRFIDFDASAYASFRVDGHISWASYARIFIPDLVEPTLDKVLYLDCDLLITDSIRPLWETDLGEAALGVIPNPISDRRIELGIPPDRAYFNAGVLLMNLAAWRRRGITARLVEFIAANSAILKFHDQDTLNACLHDQTVELPLRWNVHHVIFGESAARLGLAPAAHRALVERPGIVHFTSFSKPWHFLNEHPWKRGYWEVLRRTPWRDFRYADVTASSIAKRLLRPVVRRARRALGRG